MVLHRPIETTILIGAILLLSQGGPLSIPGVSASVKGFQGLADMPSEFTPARSDRAACNVGASELERVRIRMPVTAPPPVTTQNLAFQPTDSDCSTDLIDVVILSISGVSPYTRISTALPLNNLSFSPKSRCCAGLRDRGASLASSRNRASLSPSAISFDLAARSLAIAASLRASPRFSSALAALSNASAACFLALAMSSSNESASLRATSACLYASAACLFSPEYSASDIRGRCREEKRTPPSAI